MATLPSASVSVSTEASAGAGGTGYCVVIAPVGTSADTTPRVYNSWSAIVDQHDYAPGVGYAALHIEETGKPVIFVGIPIATAGVVGSNDSTGVTGTCNITVSGTPLEEVDAIFTVTTGGTIGTTGIKGTLSLDNGVTEKQINLGTATSYVIPYVGLTLAFTAGTLVAADVYTFRSTAPMWDSVGMAAARTALVAQQKLSRSWLIAGDVPTDTFATYVTTATNGYETTNKRFTYARVNIKDRLPLAKKSKVKKRMTGSPELTFAEVGATGDTLTRATGSWVTDGFVTGDLITVAGTASNNFTDAVITGATATVLTFDSQDLVAEVIAAGVTVVGSETLTFAEVGATADTITRATGSWTADGFAVGDIVTITGTASNNVTTDAIAALSATVMTLGSTDLAAEVIAGHRVSVVKVLTKASWMTAADTEFAPVDEQKRIDIGAGRATKLCPITGYSFRRPASWAASIREYQHDLHVTTWNKEDGPLDGWSLEDADGNISEFDERVDGGGLAARFTCLRTWGNGPNGTFVAMSLTRDTEGSLLSYTHNMAVANLACTIVQTATENIVGKTLVLNDDGTATSASLQVIEEAINTDLEQALLRQFVPGEGPRASMAVWRAATDDDLSVVDATLTGVLDLRLNGTIVHVTTEVRVS